MNLRIFIATTCYIMGIDSSGKVRICLSKIGSFDVMLGCYHTAIARCIHVTVGNTLCLLNSD